MDTKAKIALGIGAGVLALGAAVGVGALAANLADGANSSAQPGYGMGGNGGEGGQGGRGQGRGGMDTSQLAATLATKLGVDKDKVETALKEVMAASRPSGQASGMPSGQPTGMPSGQPTGMPSGGQNGGQRGEFLQTLAKGLAEKLNLDEATVLAALQESWQSQGYGQGGSGAPSAQPTK
jgi:hypothetical protein